MDIILDLEMYINEPTEWKIYIVFYIILFKLFSGQNMQGHIDKWLDITDIIVIDNK
jgi:hypothetical protein